MRIHPASLWTLALLASVPSLLAPSVVSAATIAPQVFTRGPQTTLQSTQQAASTQKTQQLSFTVTLPLRNVAELDKLIANQSTPNSPLFHHFLTPQQFAQSFAPSPQAFAQAAAILQAQGFKVVSHSSQALKAVGDTQTFAQTFATRLTTLSGQHPRLVNTTPLHIPQALHALGANVIELSPRLRHHVHVRAVWGPTQADPNNRYSALGPYFFDDLKQAYSFPSYKEYNGSGKTIAVLIDSNYNQNDITTYFAHEKLAPPKIIVRPVDGGAPFDPNSGESLEAELDLEQAGGAAPRATLALYDVPDLSDPSLYDGYSAIIADNIADIVNSSFGACELLYTAAYNGGVDATSILLGYHQLFEQGNVQGMTFVASSGDSGALGCPDVNFTHFVLGVENPASDPDVTAVGGANLVTKTVNGKLNSQYLSENAYGDPLIPYDAYGIGQNLSGGVWGSGGGKSVIYPKPFYQFAVQTHVANARTVPDVALHMGGCPSIAQQPCGANRSGDVERFAGGYIGVIGTSAAAPAYAGLLALQETAFGGPRLGNVNYLIYSIAYAQNFSPVKYFRTNIPGNNGLPATAGYNEVLGNGTIIGNDYTTLYGGPVAGVPQSPSNP